MSLNKISKSLSLSKSTVYCWFRKFKGKTIKEVTINYGDLEDVGELIGAFAGDGNYFLDRGYKYQIRIFINSKDVAYVKHLSKLITRITNKRPWIYTRTAVNVTELRMVSKQLYVFIRTYLTWCSNKTATVKLNANLPFKTEFFCGFLRGLIDTDGYIDLKTAKFSTVSHGLAKNIEDSLKVLSISYRVYLGRDKRGNRLPIYRIVISKDFNKFISQVKPQHFNYLHTNIIQASVV